MQNGACPIRPDSSQPALVCETPSAPTAGAPAGVRGGTLSGAPGLGRSAPFTRCPVRAEPTQTIEVWFT